MQNRILEGSLTAAYTQTQYDNGLTPKLGAVYFDPATSKKYLFVKNDSATAAAASLTLQSLGTDKSAYFVTVSAGTDALKNFAGVRVVGATSLADDEYGWIQVSGPASFLHSGGEATTADGGVVTSASVAGKVEGEAGTAIAGASFARAQAAKTTLDEVVLANIVFNVWGL